MCVACSHRWGSPDSQIPVVRFLNGRELPISPELFTAEVQGVGSCKRTQVGAGRCWREHQGALFLCWGDLMACGVEL